MAASPLAPPRRRRHAGGPHAGHPPRVDRAELLWSFGYARTDLVKAIGGKDQALARLDRLLSIDSSLSMVPTPAQLNGGQDAETVYMGNEMGFNAPWAYNWRARRPRRSSSCRS